MSLTKWLDKLLRIIENDVSKISDQKFEKIRIMRAKMSIKKMKLMEEKVYLFLRQNLLSIKGTSTANGEAIVDDNNR